MLTLPSTDRSTGQVSRQVFPIDSDEILNVSQTGSVMLISTSDGPVELTLPLNSRCQDASIYFLLVCGANLLEIIPQGDDSIADGWGLSTSTQWSMVVLRGSAAGVWTITVQAGVWNDLTSTTT